MNPHVPSPEHADPQRRTYTGCGCPALGHRPGCPVPGRRRLRSARGRIRVRPGRGGSLGRPMRRTLVELPFSELNPSMALGCGTAHEACARVLEGLSPGARDVVLANLLAKFGTVER